MSSIQERLQLKRVPLDTWNIREQLCLASAVVRSGDQNWMSVSRALKTVGEANRPPDWYSQKSCAAQYGALLEHVETPKRKKRSSEGAVETPQESILKRLTQERIVEIQKSVAEMNQQYEQVKNETAEVRNPATSDDRLRELWNEIDAATRAREKEIARRTAWLKEREERRARSERTWRPPHAPHASPPSAQIISSSTSPAPPSSPLLTSLLKSSPVVTTPQHIPHPATVVETVSPSAGAPTLSMLLEKAAGSPASSPHDHKHAAIEHIKNEFIQIEQQLKGESETVSPSAGAPTLSMLLEKAAGSPASSPQDHKHAAIEHIKNEFIQIEQQLKASSATPPPAPQPAPSPAPAPPSAVDIDDIEIKAEDVYAFRDVDIHIPPVTTIHKPAARVEKPVLEKDEQDTPAPDERDAGSEHALGQVKEEPVASKPLSEEMLPVDIETITHTPMEEAPTLTPATEEAASSATTVEMRFPAPEIKVLADRDQQVKEEAKEVDAPVEQEDRQQEEEEEEVNVEDVPVVVVEEQSQPPPLPTEEPPPETQPECSQEEEPAVEDQLTAPADPADIPLPPVSQPEQIPLPSDPPLPPEPEVAQDEAEENVNVETLDEETNLQPQTEEKTEETIAEDDIKKEEDAEEEDSIPLKEMIREEISRKSETEVDVKEEPAAETEETHTETDDDTPMELSREEEKDGKKRRDYSRKKKPDSRTCSGSESAAEASAPESPGAGSSTDAERQHRLWKKSVMLVYSRLCAHKYAPIFLRPISDDEAPGYSIVIKRPMDLTTIRRNIESGSIRTTAEFQRDVLLMLSNALVYNSSSHEVYIMAKELFQEAQCQLGMLLAAQAHAGLVAAPPSPAPHTPGAPPPPARRKRRRPDSPHTPTMHAHTHTPTHKHKHY